MRNHFSFRSPKNIKKNSQNQRNNANHILTTITERPSLRRGKSDSQNVPWSNQLGKTEAQEWLFSDEKIKADHYHIIRRKKIGSLLQTHQFDPISKENLGQNKIEQNNPAQNQQTIQEIHLFQQDISRIKDPIKMARKYSRQDTKRQEASLNQETQKTNLQRVSTQRSNKSANSGIRETLNMNDNTETYLNFNVFLKKAESLSVKKTDNKEQKKPSPKIKITNKAAVLKTNPQNIQTNIKKEQFRQKYLSNTMTILNRGLENRNNDQNQKFLLNGWQINSPISPDIFGIHRYSHKDSQLVPASNQRKT